MAKTNWEGEGEDPLATPTHKTTNDQREAAGVPVDLQGVPVPFSPGTWQSLTHRGGQGIRRCLRVDLPCPRFLLLVFEHL